MRTEKALFSGFVAVIGLIATILLVASENWFFQFFFSSFIGIFVLSVVSFLLIAIDAEIRFRRIRKQTEKDFLEDLVKK